MKKIEEAKLILQEIGMPKKQQTDLCGYTLLAMSSIGEDNDWSSSKNDWIKIHDIIQFLNNKYDIMYAENSRETFRKQAIHHFRNAAIIEDNGKSTNSPNFMYRLTDEFLTLIRIFNNDSWDSSLIEFKNEHGTLIDKYASKKRMQKMPVKINNEDFLFSPGEHNELQKYIIEDFAPRFAPGSECLYVGDTIKKDLVNNIKTLKELGFVITKHDKMPDVVLYKEDKNWIYFIESVTTVGPMDPKRIIEINQLTKNVKAGKVFVTAFLDFGTYKKFSTTIAWETEVWIAAMPDHMIHLNGDRFLGPR
ncbi:BsuBI/PstI family type II restriction endonuclease [Lactococcus lactis]|uniref:BsuBI/PstI family type II restriction endonuclease n=1 Tax=Lactococcus lactis TaxID=1358 RepID=A0ABD5GPW3_9LACT|nr:BsuBI/PstI family type II restriction endonuclease [Lactococcus lactis]MDV2618281.1 BsuBI/PstI family type II restriction endonuclease [Lactococcus lactis]